MSPIIISWVRPNGYGYISTLERELGFRNFVHSQTKRQEAREELERKLVEGKNWELK